MIQLFLSTLGIRKSVLNIMTPIIITIITIITREKKIQKKEMEETKQQQKKRENCYELMHADKLTLRSKRNGKRISKVWKEGKLSVVESSRCNLSGGLCGVST